MLMDAIVQPSKWNLVRAAEGEQEEVAPPESRLSTQAAWAHVCISRNDFYKSNKGFDRR
jgi:hypothetical protein